MQNVATKKHTFSLAAILVALMLCLMTFTGFSAKAVTNDESLPDDPAPVKIGISYFSDSELYIDICLGMAADLTAKGNDVHISASYDGYDQRDDIYDMINEGVKELIIVTQDPLTILPAVDSAYYNYGIGITVLGDYVSIFPEETVFIAFGDYYDLGLEHAAWIISNNPNLDNNSVVCVYYFNDINGNDYLNGVCAGLAAYGIIVKPIAVQDEVEAQNKTADLLGQYGNIDEIATYLRDIAKAILQYYYDNDYIDVEIGEGTGIRALSYDDDYEGEDKEDLEAAQNDFTQSIIDSINSVLNARASGDEPPYSEKIGECYVLYVGFAPGYVQYVEK